MKNYVARALQISIMSKDQIESLHSMENSIGYLLPNWNIQQLYSLPTIKESYQIPEKEEVFNIHGSRIESELKNKGLIAVETSDATQLNSDVSWTNSFDWNVHNKKSEIIWEFSSYGYGRGKLTDQIKSMSNIYG
jgi:hypothetical protein